MHLPRVLVLALLVSVVAQGCSQANLPALLPDAGGAPGAGITGATPPTAPPGGAETTLIVEGTPTEVYTQIAHRALLCWFGADGPLKATHVFHADAAPPREGGAADIVLRERDAVLHEERGVSAFRISLRGEGSGVRVVIANLTIAEGVGGLMLRDVDSWARGGEGCEARKAYPPATASPAVRLPKAGAGTGTGARTSTGTGAGTSAGTGTQR
jgi:hypothetical protein